MNILLCAYVGGTLQNHAVQFVATVDIPRNLIGNAVLPLDIDLRFRHIDPLKDIEASAGATQRHDVTLAI